MHVNLQVPGSTTVSQIVFPDQPEVPIPEKRKQDIIQQVTGDIGRWQMRTILLIFLCKIPSAWFMAAVIYTAPAPKSSDFYCQPPETVEINGSADAVDWVKKSHPSHVERETDKEFEVDFCQHQDKEFATNYSHYANPFEKPMQNGKQLIPCSTIEKNPEYNSLITDFNLMCSGTLLVSVTQSAHALGTLTGGLISGEALDIISPRRFMMVGMIASIFSGNLTGLVNSYELHIFFRCVTAAACAFMYTSGQRILADITNRKSKTVIVTLFELFWSIGLILLPVISIFFDSWTYLYVFISSSTIILVFLHRWISDSPRWHIEKGNIDDTLGILLECAAYNNTEIPLDLEHQLNMYLIEIRNSKSTSVNYFSIWDGETRRAFIFALHMAWMVWMMLYHAMVPNIRAFGVEHLHVNTAVMGFAEMIGIFIGLYFILYTRRRWFWVGILVTIFGGLTFFVWLVPRTIKESRRVGFEMMFSVGLKVANASSLSVLTTCSNELVTEPKRKMLMKSVVTWSRIWLLIAPFIVALSVINHLLPITIFAVLAVFNGLSMWYIDRKFWNRNQPRIERVPTLKTFRKNSVIILSRRNSASSVGSINVPTSTPSQATPMISRETLGPELPHFNRSRRASIADFWAEVQVTEAEKETRQK